MIATEKAAANRSTATVSSSKKIFFDGMMRMNIFSIMATSKTILVSLKSLTNSNRHKISSCRATTTIISITRFPRSRLIMEKGKVPAYSGTMKPQIIIKREERLGSIQILSAANPRILLDQMNLRIPTLLNIPLHNY